MEHSNDYAYENTDFEDDVSIPTSISCSFHTDNDSLLNDNGSQKEELPSRAFVNDTSIASTRKFSSHKFTDVSLQSTAPDSKHSSDYSQGFESELSSACSEYEIAISPVDRADATSNGNRSQSSPDNHTSFVSDANRCEKVDIRSAIFTNQTTHVPRSVGKYAQILLEKGDHIFTSPQKTSSNSLVDATAKAIADLPKSYLVNDAKIRELEMKEAALIKEEERQKQCQNSLDTMKESFLHKEGYNTALGPDMGKIFIERKQAELGSVAVNCFDQIGKAKELEAKEAALKKEQIRLQQLQENLNRLQQSLLEREEFLAKRFIDLVREVEVRQETERKLSLERSELEKLQNKILEEKSRAEEKRGIEHNHIVQEKDNITKLWGQIEIDRAALEMQQCLSKEELILIKKQENDLQLKLESVEKGKEENEGYHTKLEKKETQCLADMQKQEEELQQKSQSLHKLTEENTARESKLNDMEVQLDEKGLEVLVLRNEVSTSAECFIFCSLFTYT